MSITPSSQLATGYLGGEKDEAWKAIGGADGVKKLLAQRDESTKVVLADFRKAYAKRLYTAKPVKSEKEVVVSEKEVVVSKERVG